MKTPFANGWGKAGEAAEGVFQPSVRLFTWADKLSISDKSPYKGRTFQRGLLGAGFEAEPDPTMQ